MSRTTPTVRALLGVLAALAISEAALRPIYWIPTIPDPRLGSILPAGTRARYCREGCAASFWAADGVRRVAPIDPRADSVLVLGDSFTEALMTDDDAVYTQRVEEALARANIPLQVLNLGRSGASTADYLALAEYYAERFAARWTVIQLRANDFETDAWDLSKTHLRESDAGQIEAVEVPPRVSRLNRWIAPLRRRSSLASLGSIRVREFAAAAAADPPMFFGAQVPTASTGPTRVYPVEATIEALATAYADRVTLLYLPEYDARDPSRKGAAERRFARACAARARSCVSLREAFATFAQHHSSPYGFANSQFNSGHMNDAGHAAVADLLFAEFRRLAALDLL